jgi:AcrR family transcriptional regulator
MRARLLDAAIECIVEFGYASTTVTRVAERAGVTRGAQVHHFPTKFALTSATIERLTTRFAEAAQSDTDPGPSLDAWDDILDLLWRLHRGPLFLATVELWTAARADTRLTGPMRAASPLIDAAILTAALDLLARAGERIDGAGGGARLGGDAVRTAMTAVRGLVIEGFGLPPDQVESRWLPTRMLLRRYLDGTGPAVPEPSQNQK